MAILLDDSFGHRAGEKTEKHEPEKLSFLIVDDDHQSIMSISSILIPFGSRADATNYDELNPVFRKYIAADKNYIAQIPQNVVDLLSVIFTFLIVFGVCGGAKTIFFSGAQYISFVPFLVAILGIVGLVVMYISIRGNPK